MSLTSPNHWKLGLFVVVGVVLAIATTIYVVADGLDSQHVKYTTFLDESVQGLDVAPALAEVGRVPLPITTRRRCVDLERVVHPELHFLQGSDAVEFDGRVVNRITAHDHDQFDHTDVHFFDQRFE